MRIMFSLVLVLALSLSGCSFLRGGVLGELADSYRNVEVCIGHPKYGWACVMVDGTVYFKYPPKTDEERKLAVEWARAEAEKVKTTDVPK